VLRVYIVLFARTCVGIFRVWGLEFAHFAIVRCRVRGLRMLLEFEVYGVGFANI